MPVPSICTVSCHFATIKARINGVIRAMKEIADYESMK